MTTEIFNRRENKYLIPDTAAFDSLFDRMSDHIDTGKARKSYNISNIYYDTDDNRLIRTSLEKPVYKEKLRLRAYGTPDLHSKVFVEIKKKYNGVVNKRRSTMELREAYDFLETGTQPASELGKNPLVLTEIETMFSRYDLKPALYLSYDRIALGENGTDDVRITFDTNITTRRCDLRLESGSYGEKLLPDGVHLMEIKAENNMPLWLSRLLDEYGIYPTSFSKYGTEYKKTLARKSTFFIIPAFGAKQHTDALAPIFTERMVRHA